MSVSTRSGIPDVPSCPTDPAFEVTPRLEAWIGEIKYPTECMLPWSA